MIFYGALAALGGAAIYANLPTRWTIGAVVPTAAYLSKDFLVPVHDEHNVKQEDGVEVCLPSSLCYYLFSRLLNSSPKDPPWLWPFAVPGAPSAERRPRN